MTNIKLGRQNLPTFVRSLGRILAGRPRVPASLADNRLLQMILQRRSVRRFRREPIPEDAFAAIIEAGRVAPSTVNLQTWSFARFSAETWQATFGHPLPFGAPAAIIVMADTHRARAVLDVFPVSPLVEYTIGVMNASLAAMNMNLAAEALGISSVMLSETGRSGFLDAAYLRDRLSLPDHVIPLTTLVLGYAAGLHPAMPPKLPDDTVSFAGRYREADRAIMQAWLDEMRAGYNASHLGSTFEAQLRVYASKIDQAEADLQEMVLDQQPASPA